MERESKRLVRLLEVDESRDRVWSEAELGAVYRHQLSSTIRCDLAGLRPQTAAQVHVAAAASDLLLRSYADLFQHPHPPVEILTRVKDFARRSRLGRGSPLPSDIASVLYYLSIACALVRCEQRITTLSDDELRSGLTWCLDRSWLEEASRELLRQCLNALSNPGDAS